MTEHWPEFRIGSVLPTSFTGTLTERRGERLERLPAPRRLIDFLAVFELPVHTCSPAEFERARVLREAVHEALSAAAAGERPPETAVEVINESSARGAGHPRLDSDSGLVWVLGADTAVDDALGVISAETIAILSGHREGRLALCASESCRAAFFDTSRSRSRRWCDMNTCGNKEKKARFRARAPRN